MNEETQKPTSIIYNEFIVKLANVINESMLPPFVIESVLKDAYMEIKDIAEKQYEYDKEQYDGSLNSCDEQECEDITIQDLTLNKE